MIKEGGEAPLKLRIERRVRCYDVDEHAFALFEKGLFTGVVD